MRSQVKMRVKVAKRFQHILDEHHGVTTEPVVTAPVFSQPAPPEPIEVHEAVDSTWTKPKNDGRIWKKKDVAFVIEHMDWGNRDLGESLGRTFVAIAQLKVFIRKGTAPHQQELLKNTKRNLLIDRVAFITGGFIVGFMTYAVIDFLSLI